MRSNNYARENYKPRFNREPEYREELNSLPLNQLMIATVLLSHKHRKAIPKDRESLTQICIHALADLTDWDRAALFENTIAGIQKLSTTSAGSQWIKDSIPKRLEAFLRSKTRLTEYWVDVEGLSSKQHFLLAYDIKRIEQHLQRSRQETLSLPDLKWQWAELESLNELKKINKADIEEFLAHSTKEYKKILTANNQIRSWSRTGPPHLETLEDVLIWLDLYSNLPLERQAIMDTIHKSWQQKQYRKNSSNKQKNFNLKQSTVDALKKLADKNNMSETQVITILINEELKNEAHIKKVLDRADALSRAIESE